MKFFFTHHHPICIIYVDLFVVGELHVWFDEFIKAETIEYLAHMAYENTCLLCL